jgi:hypothetical protein
VVLQAVANKITCWQAAKILGNATGTCGGSGSATWKRATTDSLTRTASLRHVWKLCAVDCAVKSGMTKKEIERLPMATLMALCRRVC